MEKLFLIKVFVYDVQVENIITTKNHVYAIFDNYEKNKMGLKIYAYSLKLNKDRFIIDKLLKYYHA